MQVSANTQALRTRIIGRDFSSYLTSWNLKTTSGQHLSLGCWWGINFVPTKSPDDRSDSLVAIDAARCHAGNLWACPEP